MPRNTWRDALGGGRRVAIGAVEARRAGSARSSPARRRSGGPSRRAARRAAIWSRSQRWKTHAPFSPIVFSSLRRRSAHFSAQKSANSGRSTRRSTSLVPLVRDRDRPGRLASRRGREAGRWRRGRPGAGRPDRRPGRRVDPQSRSLAKTARRSDAIALRAAPDEPGPVGREGQPAGRATVPVADGNGRLAGPPARTRPSIETSNLRRVADVVGRLPRDVAGRAILELGGDDELLVDAPVQDPLGGEDAERLDPSSLRAIAAGARGDPADQRLGLDRIRAKSDAPFVGDLTGRLADDQAFARRSGRCDGQAGRGSATGDRKTGRRRAG